MVFSIHQFEVECFYRMAKERFPGQKLPEAVVTDRGVGDPLPGLGGACVQHPRPVHGRRHTVLGGGYPPPLPSPGGQGQG